MDGDQGQFRATAGEQRSDEVSRHRLQTQIGRCDKMTMLLREVEQSLRLRV